MVRQALGINFENFLQKTEPLYIIPRIASCYAVEGDKEKLMGIVYKEWLKDVVEKAWVKPLNAYIDEYGERIVLSAIYYLIDNGLWEVYEGRLALDAQEDNYYDKLGDMPSAIEFVQEQQAEEKKAEEKKAAEEAATAENASVPSDSIAGQKKFSPDHLLSAEEAISLANHLNEISSQLTESVGGVIDYICTAADTDVLRKKINDQQQRIEELKSQHKEEVKTLQQKVDEGISTMQKSSDFISKLRQEAKEAQKQYDELNVKYKKALDERDDADKELETYKKILEEEANREQLPKKKVIPYSVLDAVPLLGKGVMTGLVPVLAKYNIVVDYNK